MKKIVCLLLCIFIAKNALAQDMNINAKSAILIEQTTGQVLFAKNEHEKREIASMTKIMSMLLVMEKINEGTLKYDDYVDITTEASSMGGSQVFIQAGERYKVHELLKSVAMASANDAITALAIKTYGSIESFVEKMNEKAKKLGLKNTNFVNVHGLDSDNHYSTASDMAVIAKELLKYDDILKYTSVYEEYLQKPNGSKIWLVNTNKLVRFYDGVDGLKTGYTQKAGYCLTATAKKNNLRLISVVMGEDTIENRSQDTVKLLNYGFNTYKINLIKSKKDILGKVKVENGKKEYVNLVLINDIVELLKSDKKESEYNFKLDIKKLKAPVKKGSKIGEVRIYDKKKNLINKVEITVEESIGKANFMTIVIRNLRKICTFS